MLLLIDNYDSFVYNLARYVAELGVESRVVRNDAITVAEIARLQPAAILLSPGPCTPAEAGVTLDVVRELRGRIPMFGVCLGHQAIGAAYGGRVVRTAPVHGRTSAILHGGHPLFDGLPCPFPATRYHSLVVEAATLPSALDVIATTSDGLIMGLAHRSDAVYSVQFHPESILTEGGHRLLANFLKLAGVPAAHAPGAERTPDDEPSPPSHELAGYPLHWPDAVEEDGDWPPIPR